MLGSMALKATSAPTNFPRLENHKRRPTFVTNEHISAMFDTAQ